MPEGDAPRPRRPWLTASRWLLTAAAAFVPLAAGYVPFAGRAGIFMSHTTIPAQSAALGLLLGAALLCWAVALLRGETDLRRVPDPWLPAAFSILVLLSCVTALDRTVAVFGAEYAEQGLLTGWGYLGAFVLATQVVEDRSRFLRVLQVIAASGGVVALFGVLQSAGLPYFPLPQEAYLVERGTSTLGNPDTLGTFLIVPLLVSLGLSVATTSRWRWLWRAVAAVTATSLFLTQTRGAWLGALVALAVFGVLMYRSRDTSSSRTLGASAALLVVAGVGVALYKAATGAQPLLWRVAQTFGGANSDGGRLLVWSEVAKVVAKYPLLGAGPDNTLYAWYQVATSAHVRTMGIDGVINEAHSYWMGTAVSSGVVAAALLLLFVGRVMWGARSGAVARPGAVAPPERVVYAALWAGVGGLCVALVFSVVLTPIGLMLWLSLGLLVSAKVRPDPETPTPRGARSAILAVSAAVGLLLLTWGALTGLSSTTEYAASGGPARVQAARNANALAPWRQHPLLLEAQTLQAEGASRDQVLPVLDRLLALAPRGYEYYVVRARLVADRPEAVIDTADRGLAAYPAGLRLIAQRAVAQAMLGDFVPAERAAAAAWRVSRDVIADYRDPSVGIAYVQVLGASGDFATARIVLDELLATFPESPEVRELETLLDSAER